MIIPATKILSDYIYKLQWEDLPREVIESTKVLLLDYLASAIAGYKINRNFNTAVTKLYYDMGGKEESSVLFNNSKLPAPCAAFLNAAYGHGADMDDGHRIANGHPGTIVIPVALALGEVGRLSGRDVILSIVAGYDVFVRIATAVNPSHLNRGFHTTGTVGTIAAGGTAAKSLKLGVTGVQNALSLSALQAAGLLEVLTSGQSSKPLHPAKAAYNGIISGRMAQAGVDGPNEVLTGEKGFAKAFTDNFDFEAIQKGLGKDFAITTCYMKPYPACRHVHGAVDAAISLGKTNSCPVDFIEKITVHTYPTAIRLTGSIIEPLSEEDAKFSLRYAVATGFIKGNFTLAHLDISHNFDNEIRTLVHKIVVVSDSQMESRAYNIRGARVELSLKDGTCKTVEIPLPKGEPEVPFSQKDLENKLKFCAEGIISIDKQKSIIRMVSELDEMLNLDELSKLLIF